MMVKPSLTSVGLFGWMRECRFSEVLPFPGEVVVVSLVNVVWLPGVLLVTILLSMGHATTMVLGPWVNLLVD